MEFIQIHGLSVGASVTLYIAFWFGSVLVYFLRAGTTKGSKISVYKTRLQYMWDNLHIFVFRTAAATLLLIYWLYHPDAISKLLITFGIPANFSNWLQVTANPATCFGAGILGDRLVDKIQFKYLSKIDILPDFLKGELPKYPAIVEAAVNAMAEQHGTEAVKTEADTTSAAGVAIAEEHKVIAVQVDKEKKPDV